MDDANWHLTLIPHLLRSHGFNWSSRKQMSQTLHLQANKLTSHDLWPSFVTFDLLNMQRLLHYINKPCLVLIGFQLFKWGKSFTSWAHLSNWLLMTFEFGIWPLTPWTYKGFHIVSINRVWFQSDFNFPNKAHSVTWPYSFNK